MLGHHVHDQPAAGRQRRVDEPEESREVLLGPLADGMDHGDRVVAVPHARRSHTRGVARVRVWGGRRYAARCRVASSRRVWKGAAASLPKVQRANVAR
eukprot:5837156-Prymnesium_polylepis.1